MEQEVSPLPVHIYLSKKKKMHLQEILKAAFNLTSSTPSQSSKAGQFFVNGEKGCLVYNGTSSSILVLYTLEISIPVMTIKQLLEGSRIKEVRDIK